MHWHDGKVALEALFFTGAIGASRRVNFERHYDLIERTLPGRSSRAGPDSHRRATRACRGSPPRRSEWRPWPTSRTELCAGRLGLVNGVSVSERGDLAPALKQAL